MRVYAPKFFEVVKRLELHSTTLSVLDVLMLNAETSSFTIDLRAIAAELDFALSDVEAAVRELLACGLLVQTISRQGVRLFELDREVFPRGSENPDTLALRQYLSSDGPEVVDL